MKVAQLLNPFEHIAGIERFVLETSREMSIRGIETRIYTASVDPGTYLQHLCFDYTQTSQYQSISLRLHLLGLML